MLEEGIDHFEDGALLGGGELFDLLEALHEACARGPSQMSFGPPPTMHPRSVLVQSSLVGQSRETARTRSELALRRV